VSPHEPIRLILNNSAALDATLEESIRTLREAGRDVDVCRIQREGHAVELARDLPSGGPPLVIAAGGDGTLNEVARGLREGGHLDTVSFGVLPYGTANDFATHFGWCDRPPAELLSALADGIDRLVDTVAVGERGFLNAASGGAGAEATTEAPDELKGALGKLAYFVSGVLRAGQLEGKRARITGESFEWSGVLLGFVIANGRCAGGNVCVAPTASLDDGRLDLVIFPALPLQDLVFIGGQYLLPPDQRQPCGVVDACSPWFRVEAEEPMQCNLDGEPIKVEDETFEVRPGTLNLRVPI